MKFCSECGAGDLQFRVPEGDNRPRHICPNCGTIHYSNPKIVAGSLVTWEDRMLICRRAIEPRHGFWTLPAGFMENNESVEQAAARETLEEANARVEVQDLFAVYSIPHISQVYMIHRAVLSEPEFGPGPESLEVELIRPADIPWDQLAFRVIEIVLRDYQRDLAEGQWRLHQGVIEPAAKR